MWFFWQRSSKDIVLSISLGGNSLAERNTLEHLRKEHFIPQLTDRRSYEAWLKTGAKNTVKRAKEKVKTILEKHRPEPLERSIQEEIEDTINMADKDLAKTA